MSFFDILMENLAGQTKLPKDKELDFQKFMRSTPWYRDFKKDIGMEPNLNDPDYDYRAFYQSQNHDMGISPDGS